MPVTISLPNEEFAYFSMAWYLVLLIVIIAEAIWNYIHPPFTKTFAIFMGIETLFLVFQISCLCLYAYSWTQGCAIYMLQRICDTVHVLSLFMSYCVWGNGYFKNVTYGVRTAWNSLIIPYIILVALIIYDLVILSLSIAYVGLTEDCTTVCFLSVLSIEELFIQFLRSS